jgi:tetratricopeptide (TPR) repeat protein
MYRTLSLSFAILAIMLLNIKAQEKSVTGIDSMETEILKILNDKTWNFWYIENAQVSPEGGRPTYELDLKDNITFSNHKLNFRTKKGIKSVSMTYGKVTLGTVSASPEIRLHLADSVVIAQSTSSGSPGSAIFRTVIENNNQKVRDLLRLFKAYQSFPLTEMYKKDLEKFRILADDYGKTVGKPSMTEEQRRLIVQANALNDKHSYSGALEKYKKAVELNPVSYPQAYYNMALIAAQSKEYKYAILNMKKYLLLVPDAEDARAGQDKIYEWEIETDQ